MMLSGRDLCGLPVFSLRENRCLGHVSDVCLDVKAMALAGLVLDGRRTFKKVIFLPAAALRRVYADGIVALAARSLQKRRLKRDVVSYFSFMKTCPTPLDGEEIVTDIVFDDDLKIGGYEISGGLWRDLGAGRRFCPRLPSF